MKQQAIVFLVLGFVLTVFFPVVAQSQVGAALRNNAETSKKMMQQLPADDDDGAYDKYDDPDGDANEFVDGDGYGDYDAYDAGDDGDADLYDDEEPEQKVNLRQNVAEKATLRQATKDDNNQNFQMYDADKDQTAADKTMERAADNLMEEITEQTAQKLPQQEAQREEADAADAAKQLAEAVAVEKVTASAPTLDSSYYEGTLIYEVPHKTLPLKLLLMDFSGTPGILIEETKTGNQYRLAYDYPTGLVQPTWEGANKIDSSSAFYSKIEGPVVYARSISETANSQVVMIPLGRDLAKTEQRALAFAITPSDKNVAHYMPRNDLSHLIYVLEDSVVQEYDVRTFEPSKDGTVVSEATTAQVSDSREVVADFVMADQKRGDNPYLAMVYVIEGSSSPNGYSQLVLWEKTGYDKTAEVASSLITSAEADHVQPYLDLNAKVVAYTIKDTDYLRTGLHFLAYAKARGKLCQEYYLTPTSPDSTVFTHDYVLPKVVAQARQADASMASVMNTMAMEGGSAAGYTDPNGGAGSNETQQSSSTSFAVVNERLHKTCDDKEKAQTASHLFEFSVDYALHLADNACEDAEGTVSDDLLAIVQAKLLEKVSPEAKDCPEEQPKEGKIDCPEGFEYDPDAPNGCAEIKEDCPKGYEMDQWGDCYLPEKDTECPEGYIEDQWGDCAKPEQAKKEEKGCPPGTFVTLTGCLEPKLQEPKVIEKVIVVTEDVYICPDGYELSDDNTCYIPAAETEPLILTPDDNQAALELEVDEDVAAGPSGDMGMTGGIISCSLSEGQVAGSHAVGMALMALLLIPLGFIRKMSGMTSKR